MFKISDSISVPLAEIKSSFVRASGPGGQNINKVATAVQLRFDVAESPSLPADVKARLLRLAGKRLNDDGVLTIDARRYRTQEQNRADALDRLANLVREAAERPKPRRVTRPSDTSRAKRLNAKKRRGEIKRLRRYFDEGS